VKAIHHLRLAESQVTIRQIIKHTTLIEVVVVILFTRHLILYNALLKSCNAPVGSPVWHHVTLILLESVFYFTRRTLLTNKMIDCAEIILGWLL